ncbi:OmpH family outer membrane protein [Hymenobacter caeli]|uniref:Outer membrane protein n=1 Tax=Hymenobacter caeli TaxID=2735894 RepID=A0ABX2FRS6_9BACT|nr:OmpH family outer membrane protein [Hymenobacter caeli]NRT19890.1 outer membrane protein [Hymenobacter caeli]
MKNTLQIVFNAVLLLAVAVLYLLHFRQPTPATAPVAAATEAPAAAATPADTATAAPAVAEQPVVPPVVPAAEAAANADQIAYIEEAKLLDGYQGMKDARRAFGVKAKGWEGQNQALVASFRTAVEAYQKQAPTLTPEQRAATEQKLQAQQQQSGEQQQKLQAQAQQEEAKLTQTVLGAVNKKVEAYGKAHGYKLILIAAPSGTIAYGRKDLDLTTPVLAYLNQTYKK